MKRDYRIMEHKNTGYITYQIHEVFYDDLDRVENVTYKPVVVYGSSYQNLKEDADLLMAAFNKPVLKNYF